MNCGHKCLKYMLFAFNFLFWILGLAVLGVGIYSRIKAENYDSLLGEGGVASAANILIAAGVFVALIGFVGCCGALKENKVLLIIYFILVLLIFILEIAAGVLAYTKKDLMEKHLKENLIKVVSTNYGNSDTAAKGLTKALDWFQEKVKCCGSLGVSDWYESQWKLKKLNSTSGKLLLAPESCCTQKVADCNTNVATMWKIGCIDAGKKFVKDHMWQVGGVGVGIAVIQLLVMIAAILLCRAIGKEESVA